MESLGIDEHMQNPRKIINLGGAGGVLEASWGHLERSGGENITQGGWKRGWDG